jgi:hypothetical protein
MLNDNSIIFIYNENAGAVHIRTMANPEGYRVPECTEDGEPSQTPLTLADIRMNIQSGVFRDGLLRIDPELEDEVLKKLGVYQKNENFLSEEDIKQIILEPTSENLQKIINITSPIIIEKVRYVLLNLIESDEIVSLKAVELVDMRYKELYRGKRKSDLVIKVKERKKVVNEDVEIVDNTEDTKKKGASTKATSK